MYLAVDIGGTKTLLGVFDPQGNLQETVKFPTSKDYDQFLLELKQRISNLKTREFSSACFAIPGSLDRPAGQIVNCPNLGWKDESAQSDFESILNCSVLLENDAKLGGLFEAAQYKDYRKILYLTIGTGIGIAVVVSGQLDLSVDDAGGSAIAYEYAGKKQGWEDFASGRAIVKKYGKQAEDIDDESAWKEIAEGFAVGVQELINQYSPDAVVIGGGVGQYFDKYSQLLANSLSQDSESALPVLLPAHKPTEAVVYGCYELIKTHASSAA